MDGFLAAVAAAVATGFAIELWVSHKARPRFHAAAWTVAISMYAVATWALALGLLVGWTDSGFRVFYFLGAILNIPVLALGSVALVRGERAARRLLPFLIGFMALGAWSTMVAPTVTPVASVGVPEGSSVFQRGMIDAEGVPPIPSPRTFAAIAGGLGTLVVVGLALWSGLRRGSPARVRLGNALIVAGTLAPAFGGSLTALGEGGAFAVSLLIGAVLLWAGYRVASGINRPASSASA